MFKYIFIFLNLLFLLTGITIPLFSQRGEITIEKKIIPNEKIEQETIDKNNEKTQETKEEHFKEEFKKDTKDWKIKIYIGYIIFFISLIYVIKNLKRRKIYK